jgi:cyclopropane fatty-acyl-phospholipid synthase-like methyltransferase
MASMALSDLFVRRRKDEGDSSDVGVKSLPPVHTKALSKFLASLGARQQPRLLDLGPVVGHNVTFFGEQLGCKIFVEDVSADIERHAQDGKLDAMPAFLATRFPQPDATFDGVLCWDIFDYLDKKAGQALAGQLARLLKPDGVLLAIFNASEPKPGPATYTKNIVVDPTTLKQRPYPATRGRLKPILNRDIIRMFEPLRVTEQFLLKTNIREVLFRKPT